MKAAKFQHQIEGTSLCMKRIIMATKCCSQLTSNDTNFSYSWFSRVETAEEIIAGVIDYHGMVKTRNKGFSI